MKISVTNISNEGGALITNSKDIRRKINKHYEQMYAKKVDNLDELWANFLGGWESTQSNRATEDETEILNCFISNKKNSMFSKIFPQIKFKA